MDVHLYKRDSTFRFPLPIISNGNHSEHDSGLVIPILIRCFRHKNIIYLHDLERFSILYRHPISKLSNYKGDLTERKRCTKSNFIINLFYIQMLALTSKPRSFYSFDFLEINFTTRFQQYSEIFYSNLMKWTMDIQKLHAFRI